MYVLYNIAIRLYGLLIRMAALANPKARLWLSGRKKLFHRLAKDFNGQPPCIWFHAASLGEFEQAAPLSKP